MFFYVVSLGQYFARLWLNMNNPTISSRGTLDHVANIYQP